MQRYFVSPEQVAEEAVLLEGEDARHLAVVMRARPGIRFIACDGAGTEFVAEVRSIGSGRVEAAILERRRPVAEPAWKVTVAQSLPKGDKLETIIQKGTEAGACAFAPFVSERTIVQYDARKEMRRAERWRKIAKEAAEQAHRGIVPEVAAVCGWPSILGKCREYDLALFCYEEEGRSGGGLKPVLREFRERAAASMAQPPRVLLIAGPEGGFTPREAEEAAAAGAKPVGLGRRILRTETAALVALACIAYESGEMGG
jgi:16S rRNA (uracil1498-N3)-methyltransferase